MKASLNLSRRILQITAILLIIVAIAATIFVIPQVKAEVSRGDTPMVAVTAFWVNIIFTVVAAVVIWFISFRTKGRNFIQSFFLGLMAFITLILGWLLSDAGGAYITHSPEMHTASIVLFVCAGIDFLAVILVIIAMLFFPKKA